MSDDLFSDEIKFPEELESMLSMSFHYDKLQVVMRFILDLLKRHEQGIRLSFSKHNMLTPEIYSLHAFKEFVESKVSTMERNIVKVTVKVEEVKHSLDERGDTVETLKFLLNMITSHDAEVLIYKKQIAELQQQGHAHELRLAYMEESLKDLQESRNEEEDQEEVGRDLGNHEKMSNIMRIKIPEARSNTLRGHRKKSSSDLSVDTQSRAGENNSRPDSTTKETSRDLSGYKAPSRRYRNNRENSSESLLIPINETEILEESLQSHPTHKIKPQRPSSKSSMHTSHEAGLNSPGPTPESLQNSPLIRKNTLAEDLASEEDINRVPKSTFLLTSPRIPEHVKEILSRIQNIEKVLESPEENNEVKTRLGKLEGMYKFIEGVLDSCEPLTLRNRDEIMRIVRGLKNLETEMVNKLNTEEFDAIKTLVIALASGSNSHNPAAVMPTREINTIRVLEKKLADIEVKISDMVKIYPENIEEVVLKLRRIEQKLEAKADVFQVGDLKQTLTDLIEKNKLLSTALLTKEKSPVNQGQKNSDSTLFASINRRLSSFEEILRNLKIPYGMDLTHLWDEVKRMWEALRSMMSSLDEYKKQESSKILEIRQILDAKCDADAFKLLDAKIKKLGHELTDRCTAQFAEKIDMRRGFKYLEALIKSHEFNDGKAEGDDAMLARKPLGGWSCASCEKKIDSLTGKIALHTPWSKLPLRDSTERILKAGPGYSRMLTTLQLDTLRTRDTDEITLPSIRNTDRSITPQPY